MNKVIVNTELEVPLPEEYLQTISTYAEKVLEHLNIHDWELSFLICSKAAIQGLNSQYRQIDEPTDVLSFMLGDYYIDADSGKEQFIAGDIAICPDIVRENAERFSVSSEEETKRVIIHGILHLSGLDHATNDATETMLQEQENILNKLKEVL
ncbi:MAG: rRNA maturation RNase YbeY [Spirochaetaceae bacterium]|jgi:probable rRNA maturation factor|nr:rRNA maturation RNase YbeY [Spirochaetaceae bacterium]